MRLKVKRLKWAFVLKSAFSQSWFIFLYSIFYILYSFIYFIFLFHQNQNKTKIIFEPFHFFQTWDCYRHDFFFFSIWFYLLHSHSAAFTCCLEITTSWQPESLVSNQTNRYFQFFLNPETRLWFRITCVEVYFLQLWLFFPDSEDILRHDIKD